MSDGIARVIILLGLGIMIPAGLYFRLRASTDERLDRRQEGWLILLSLRPLGLAAAVGLILFVVEPQRMAWAAFPLPAWARWTGVVFGTASILLIVWTFRNLGHNLTDTVVTRRDATLVTSGPYRWVRHPFYVAFAFAALGIVLVTSNAFIALTSAAAGCAIVARTSIEESKLVDRFGDEYRRYMQRTNRFLPRLGRRQRQ